MALTMPYCSINFMNNLILDLNSNPALRKSQCLPNSPHHHIPDRLKYTNEATDTYLVFLSFFKLIFYYLFLKIKTLKESKIELETQLLFLDKMKCNLAQGRTHRTCHLSQL